VIVVSDSSPLITLARAHHLELLREFYRQVLIPREVHEEVTVAGAGLPGADEVRRASWIEVRSDPGKGVVDSSIESACAGLGAGERSVIYLASGLKAAVVLIDEDRARRVAKNLGLAVVGSIAVLERGVQLKKVPDLRSVYLSLLDQGIRFSTDLLDMSLIRCGLGKLKQ
jgi:predicted nucleic acid-binding protein